MDMNIVIGLASMVGCAGMFLVCVAQVREILEAARQMAKSSQVMAAPREGFLHDRRYAGSSGAVFVQVDGRLVPLGF
jgi:hypothetical protein